MNAASTHVQSKSEGTANLGLLLALASETAFFGTVITAYLFMRNNETGWPFLHPTLSQLVVPSINTLVLLLSVAVVWQARNAAKQGDQAGIKRNLIIALGLGLVFVGGQIFEFNRTGMRPDDLAFGGVFFALIGFHALHVLGGEVFHGINLVRAQMGDFSEKKYTALQISAWFWVYVAVVWVVIFIALYLV